jgi:hypothetical protein
MWPALQSAIQTCARQTSLLPKLLEDSKKPQKQLTAVSFMKSAVRLLNEKY